METIELRQPIADWASKVCQYAVRKGSLELWNDCGVVANKCVNGTWVCPSHEAALHNLKR